MSQTRRKQRPAKRQPPPPPPKKNRLPWMIVVGVALVLLVVGIVISMDTGSEDDGGVSQFADADVTGDALPTFDSSSGVDVAVGTPIPEVAGASFDGSAVGITHGSPHAIMFVAHWCPHCQDEVPEVQDWLNAGSLPSGVQLTAVATSTDAGRANYPPSAWLEREGWTPPVIVDDAAGSIGSAFGLPAFPYWVFADSDGNVVARWAGGLPIEVLDSVVAELG